MSEPAPNRVVQIVAPGGLVSGKEIMTLTLAEGLRAGGWQPRIMTSVWGTGEFRRRLDADGFAYESLPLGFISLSLRPEIARMTWGQIERWPELVRGYRRILRETRPGAVVHTNWHHALLLLPWLDSGRDIYWAHEFAPTTKRYAVIFRMIAKRVARIVCISRAVAQNLQALGIAPAKLAVIHNGTDLCGSQPPPLGAGPLRVGIVGQVIAWKGHEDVLQAIALLAKQGRACELSIFGSGPPDYIEQLKAQAKKLGIDNLVHWRGFVADRAAIYNNIDVCVVPSRDPEPFGMAALEAGACARPVVCTAAGGLGEIVEDGTTGLVIPPRQPDSLAAALAKFIGDRNLLRSMGAAAQRRAAADFSRKAFIDRFIALLLKPQADAAA